MKDFFRRLFGGARPEWVPYYDFETRTVVRIPKAELRPGVVLVQIEGEAEPMYVDASSLKMGDHQHAMLSPAAKEGIARLVTGLADVHPMTYEQWEDGFRRDQTPESEIAGWLHVSEVLRVMTERHRLGSAEKAECFRVLVACFTGARETVRDRSDPKLLPSAQVEQAIKYFYERGYASS